MWRNLLISAVALLPMYAHADVASIDKFFSDEAYIGAIPCSHIKWDLSGYTNSAQAFTNTMLSDSLGTKPIENACVQGGGDCDCYIAFTAQRKIDAERSSYEVLTPSHDKVWIAAATKGAHFMLELAIRGMHGPGTAAGELNFRSPAPAIFAQAELKTPVDAKSLLDLPETVLAQFPANKSAVQLLFTARNTLMVNQKTYVQFSVDAVLDEASFACGDIPKNFAPKTEHIRDVWVEAFDDKHRITFWLTAPPPC